MAAFVDAACEVLIRLLRLRLSLCGFLDIISDGLQEPSHTDTLQNYF